MIYVSSSWSVAYQRMADITWIGSKIPYALRHGYATAPYIFEQGAEIKWGRVKSWLQILCEIEEGDWLFFTGCDALITSPEIQLEKFIVPDFDFICCADHRVIHGDGWLMRSCSATKSMLRWIINNTTDAHARNCSEQESFVSYLCGRNALFYNDTAPTNYGEDSWYEEAQQLLNRSPVRCRLIKFTEKFTGDDPALWKPGDIPIYHSWTPGHLCLHMGGKSFEERMEFLPKYLP